MDNVSFVSNNDIKKKIKIIICQTDYTEEIAKSKLIENNYDEIATIKAYFGIAEKKESVISSLNQEIYKQIRYKLDGSMKDFTIRKK